MCDCKEENVKSLQKSGWYSPLELLVIVQFLDVHVNFCPFCGTKLKNKEKGKTNVR